MELKFNLDDISKRITNLHAERITGKSYYSDSDIDENLDLYSSILKDVSIINYPDDDIPLSKKSYNAVFESYKSISRIFPNNVSKYIIDISKKLTEKNDFFDHIEDFHLCELSNITDECVHNVVFDFFNKYAPKYNDIFKFLIDNRLVHLKDYNPHVNSSCYYDSINTIPYVIIHNSEDAETYSTAIHEIAHAYWYYINQRDDMKLSFYIETPSNLSQFLYDQDRIDNNDNLISICNYFNVLKQSFFGIALMNRLNNSKFDVKKIQENFLFYNSFKDYDLEDVAYFFTSMNCLDHASYGFSLILTLHMLKIFDNDFEKGKTFYNDYILNTPNNYMKFLKKIEFDINDIDYGIQLYRDYEDKLTNQVRKRLK